MNLENLNHGDTVNVRGDITAIYRGEHNGRAMLEWGDPTLAASHFMVDASDVLARVEEVYTEPAPEEKPSPVKPGCMYMVWDRSVAGNVNDAPSTARGVLRECGAEAGERSLCPEHAAFVKDSTEGPFTRSKKAHPAGYDWNAKARAAYGIKGMTLAGMGKPSDAGKPAHNPVSRAECDAWIARRPLDPAGEDAIAPAAIAEPVAEPVTLTPEQVAEWKAGTVDVEGRPVETVTFGGPDGITIPLVGDCTVEGKPSREHVTAKLEPVPVVAEPEAGPTPAAEYTREEIEAACVRLMEHTYRGTGIPGVLWNVGFRLVYQKREGTDKQIDYLRALMVKAPDKYAQLMVEA